MRLSRLLPSIALLPALLLAGCSKPEPAAYQEQGYVFGTLVEVSIYGEEDGKARQAAASVMHEFQRLHDMLHAWQPSELSRLNTAIAHGKTSQVSPELEAILQDAAQRSVQSHGRFNPAIGGLIHAWGFQSDEFKPVLPDQEKIAALVKADPQMSDLVFEGDRVGSRNKAVQIDLGGYAKGYALDRAAGILKSMGVHNALINIGGNILALGRHGARPWRVGIQHPRKPGPLATLELHDGEAIGTSGDYQRYFELAGHRYCHLIDPRSGQPVQDMQAVTIVTAGVQAGVRSDVDSKPLFLAGEHGWRKAAMEMQLGQVLVVTGTGQVQLTAGLRKRLKFTDKSQAVEMTR